MFFIPFLLIFLSRCQMIYSEIFGPQMIFAMFKIILINQYSLGLNYTQR